MITLKPVNSKVWIKLDTAFENQEVDDKGNRFYKASKDSKILITEKAGEQQDKKFQTGTILGCPEFVKNEQDWLNEIKVAPVQFKVGDKVVVTGSNVSHLKYKGQVFSFIPAEMVWAVIKETK